MAASPSPDTRSKYDMSQSVETWHGFVRLAKWVVGLSIILLLGMATFLTGGHPPAH